MASVYILVGTVFMVVNERTGSSSSANWLTSSTCLITCPTKLLLIISFDRSPVPVGLSHSGHQASLESPTLYRLGGDLTKTKIGLIN